MNQHKLTVLSRVLFLVALALILVLVSCIDVRAADFDDEEQFIGTTENKGVVTIKSKQGDDTVIRQHYKEGEQPKELSICGYYPMKIGTVTYSYPMYCHKNKGDSNVQ